MHRSLRRLVLAIIVVALSLIGSSSPTRADASPTPWAPGNTIRPSVLTQVRMVG